MQGRIVVVVLVLAMSAQGAGEGLEKELDKEMARLAQGAGGAVGACAIHVETGQKACVNGEERFPMASTYKVPIALELLRRVDAGQERLDRLVTLEPADLHPGSGTLTDLFNKPGLALSVRNLLELMLLISDNSATDVLLRLAGGPEAVTSRMRELGIEGISVSRPTIGLISDWRKSAATFNTDPRDTATPEGMAALLVRVHRRDALKPESAELLVDIMRRCRTGGARLKGLLPAGTQVANKTGSIGGTTNDVGILTLPHDAGHVAIAVFVKASDRQVAARERAIAEIARAAHDYFLFQPPALDYSAMASRMVAALRLENGERVLFGVDPGGYFRQLVEPLERLVREAGAARVDQLEQADVYLWLPRRAEVSAAERQALQQWLDQGGPRRQIHFHWDAGSVRPDGLAGEHSPDLDRLYLSALDIDYRALSAAQDRAIAQLRGGTVRVRTPAGTDLRFRVGQRPFNKQDGDASRERMKGARVRIDRELELPAGVLRVAPLEDTVSGVLVVPEARFGSAVARGIRLTIAKGRVSKVEAAENLAAVEAALAAGGEAARRFREFGLGLNRKLAAAPGATVLPYYGYGSGVVRLSLGDNQELGGNVRGGFVRWLFFPDAVVEVDGRLLFLP